MNGVSPLCEDSDQRMSPFMICRQLAILVGNDCRLSLGPHDNAVFRVLKLCHADCQFAVPRRFQSSYIDDIGKISSAEPRRTPCYHLKV